MNKLIVLGNLGHSASVRVVPGRKGDTQVVNFSVAVKVGYGEHEYTQWYGCHWWGERAARVAEWLTKGRQVLVEGEPALRTFTKRDGSAGAEIEVRVVDVRLVGGGREAAEGAAAGSGGAAGAASGGAPLPSAAAGADEDVPY